MSYDLMVFEKSKAPKTKAEFMKWYEIQTKWSEENNCQICSPENSSFKATFTDMMITECKWETHK